MAKWKGKLKTIHRWFRSPKYLVEFRKEEGDHNAPDCPELYWCEVDALRLDFIAFDLQCRRSEVESLTLENARLRGKLFDKGSSITVRDCAARFEGNPGPLIGAVPLP